VPARPASPNGLSIGTDCSGPGVRNHPSSVRANPATLVTTTTPQRRDRSRPSGSSRAGSVTPSPMAGAQLTSETTVTSWAATGRGRWSCSSWVIQGSKGMLHDQVSPAAAYSQPIGLAGRRKLKTSPTVA
jgi:hypothetical protein